MLVILIILASTFSNVILLVLAKVFRKINSLAIFILTIIGVGFFFYALVLTINPHNLVNFLSSDILKQNSLLIAQMQDQFKAWPSSWYVNSILPLMGIGTFNILPLLLLVLASAILLIFQHLLSQPYYRKMLISTQENQQIQARTNHMFIKSTGLTQIILNDWLQMIRDRKELGQFIFFLILFYLYLGFLFSTPNLGGENFNPVWTPRIIVFILVTIAYFVILLSLRFIFPSTSILKVDSWYFLTLPKLRTKILGGRILALLLPIIFLIEMMILLTSMALHFSISLYFPIMLLALAIIGVITTLMSFLGHWLPGQAKSSPESMSTTPAGLLALVSGSLYTRQAPASAATDWAPSPSSIRNASPHFLRCPSPPAPSRAGIAATSFISRCCRTWPPTTVSTSRRRSANCRKTRAMRCSTAPARPRSSFTYAGERGKSYVKEHAFEGVIPNLERRHQRNRLAGGQGRAVQVPEHAAPAPTARARACGPKRGTCW